MGIEDLHFREIRLARLAVFLVAVGAAAGAVHTAVAQDTPLLSGGVGFFTSTNGGSTSYQPHIEPLVAAPIGPSLVVEGRGIVLEEFSPNGGGQSGYSHSHFASLLYLQGDYLATSHLTIVGGSYLIPFNTYNDRLSEIWIENLQDGPLTAGIGTMGTGTGVGGMLRAARQRLTANSTSATTRGSPRAAETCTSTPSAHPAGAGCSISRRRGWNWASHTILLLQGKHENFFGTHVWWEPKDTGLRLRSEYSHGEHAQGYWVEADYRTHAFGGPDNWVGRFEPVFRMAQTFRIDNLGSDSTSSVNTQRADFGIDYNLPHEVRILTSYGRQFNATRDTNIWETGIVYRFLFPAWKGKAN